MLGKHCSESNGRWESFWRRKIFEKKQKKIRKDFGQLNTLKRGGPEH